MKKIFYSIALATTVLLAGCDSLDLDPIDYASANNFWQNESQVETFATGLMTQLRSDMNGMSNIVLGEARGGTFRDGTSSTGVSLNYANIVTNTLTKDITGVSSWNGYYSKILQVNMMIKNLTDGCTFLSDAQKNTYLGMAHGLRAYYYFMLYRTYGGVPLETTPKVSDGVNDVSELQMARSSADETLEFVENEIDLSEDFYHAAGDVSLNRTRWSYWSTLVLKAQIYMWAAKVSTVSCDNTDNYIASGDVDIQTAKSALLEIVNSGKFALCPNFSDVFSYDNKQNNEMILELYFNKDEQAMSNANFFVPQASLFYGSFYYEDGTLIPNDALGLCGGGYGRIEYKESLVKSFDITDLRRAYTFVEYYSTADPVTREFGCAMMKYMGHEENGTRYYDSDYPLYRYADVILMLAECENYLGNDPSQYINQIRQRAYGVMAALTVDYPEYKNGTFAQNELAILQERTKEFVGEGSRWFDVLRMQQEKGGLAWVFSPDANYSKDNGPCYDPILTEADGHKTLWPVDVSTLTADSKLLQTYGY